MSRGLKHLKEKEGGFRSLRNLSDVDGHSSHFGRFAASIGNGMRLKCDDTGAETRFRLSCETDESF